MLLRAIAMRSAVRRTWAGRAALAVSVVLAVDGIAAQTARRSVWDGVYTEAQARQGAVLYAGHCATCHGEGMTGGEAVPALLGASFNATWEGLSLADLFERMRTTMPPGKTGTVPRQGYAEILSYMLQVAGMPPGQAALGNDRPSLADIAFLSSRP
jgi:mono/diheme cytochrome c family protein